MKKNLSCLLTGLFAVYATTGFAHEEDDHADANRWYLAADRSMEGFEIGGSLLYFHPETSSDMMQYAVFDTDQGNTNIETNKFINSDHDYGFDVFARYYLENGQDLTLRYTQFNGNSDDSSTCEFTDTVDHQNCTTYPSGEHFHDYAEAQMDTDFDSLDLLLGQRFLLGEQMKLRFFAGLTAAQINVNVYQHYQDIRGDGFDSYLNFDYGSEFKGIGPKVGLDGEYGFGEFPVAFFMVVSAAGLYGDSDAKTTEEQVIPNDNRNFELDGGEQQVMVPNLNADIGLRYQYEWDEEITGAASLGYRVSEYFDAIRNIKEYGANGGFTQVDDTTDFSLSGIYLELSVLL